MEYEFYSGSYAEPGEDGIVKFRMDTERGILERISACGAVRNPSYLCFNASHSVLYSVKEEVPTGALHTLRIGSGGLEPLCALSTQGADPCHISLDESGRMLLVANYTSGSLAVYHVGEDGIPVAQTQLIAHEGRGVHPARQEAPHVHCARVRGKEAFVVDLGLDKVFVYDIDEQKRALTDTGKRLCFLPGSGPRHLEFCRRTPDVVYVVCELSNQIAVFQEKDGDFVLVQLLSTLPADFEGENTAAAVKSERDFLFVSNRGHDSIAAYRIGEDGLLELSQIVHSGGKTPRDFAVFGDYLVIANQDSDSITVLKMDWEEGVMEPVKLWASTIKPCCILK